tara:strand:+ start:168 stop:359 length:192 start_codon:yes stop_codon:yes gene_type:complete
MKTFKVIMHKIIEQEHYIEAKSFDEALERAKTPESSVVSRDLEVKEYRIIEIKEIDRKDIGTS